MTLQSDSKRRTHTHTHTHTKGLPFIRKLLPINPEKGKETIFVNCIFPRHFSVPLYCLVQWNRGGGGGGGRKTCQRGSLTPSGLLLGDRWPSSSLYPQMAVCLHFVLAREATLKAMCKPVYNLIALLPPFSLFVPSSSPPPHCNQKGEKSRNRNLVNLV